MRNKLFISCIFFLWLQTLAVFAQEIKWSKYDPQAREKWTIFNDNIGTLGDYSDANLPLLQFLLEKTPDLTPLLYNNAIKLYDKMREKTTDAAKKNQLTEEILKFYDLKIKYFGDEAYTLNQKGLEASIFVEMPERQEELFELYKKVIELNGKEANYYNAYMFMALACNQRALNKVSDEEMLGYYNEVHTIAEENIQAADEDAASWQEIKDYADSRLTDGCVSVDCKTLVTKYKPKFDADPKNLELAKQIFNLLGSGGCTEEPLLLETALALYQADPNDQRAKIIALIYKKQGQEEKYLEYISKMSDKKELANVYLQLAQNTVAKGQARELALKAAEYGETSRAYSLIGNLYMRSGGECAGANAVLSRACYLAAYDMYAMAGNSSGMVRAQQQFPSKEQVFTLGLEVGQAIGVPCWIGGSTVLRTR